MSDLKQYMSRCSEKTLQSDSRGFFMQFAEGVAEVAGPKWIKNVFGKLQTDKDRLECIYTDKKVKDLVHGTLSHVEEIYRRKSAEVAIARRMEAQKMFANSGDAEKSLIIASQSVLRAPAAGKEKFIESGLTLCLSLWFRSELLLALDRYDFALKDLQMSLKEGLPQIFKAEAFARMAICYKALNEAKKSQVSQELALKLFTDEEAKNEFLETLQKVSTVQQQKTAEKPKLAKKNKSVKNASVKLHLAEDASKGRYFAAKEDIKCGETLILDEPYAACLLPDYFGTHCHYCFALIDTAIGCLDCSSVAFCSSECRDKALGTYHQYECHFLDLLIGSGMSILAHVALRMITQNPFEETAEICNLKGKKAVFSLCTLSKLRTPEDFLQRTLMAAFLLRCLQKCGYFGFVESNVHPKENQMKIAELLLYNLQMLQFNAHEIYETVVVGKNGHSFKNSSNNYIGVGVYPTAAFCNHSCNPGLIRFFVGKSIVLKACRSFKTGEEVTDNYGPYYARKTLKERRKFLAGRYWFECKCQACIENWPLLQNLDMRRVKCSNEKCTYLFTLPVLSNPKCPRCQKKVSLSGQLEELKDVELTYEQAFALMEEEKPAEGIVILNDAINRFFKVSALPHKGTTLAQECLRSLEADFGNKNVLKFV